MALSFLDNVDYRGKKPNFQRDMFTTKADMISFSENYLPDMFITTCVEDGNIYLFNRNNIVDADTGKWRKIGNSEDITTTVEPDGTTTYSMTICGIPMESTYDPDGNLISASVGGLIVAGEEAEPDTGDIDDFFGGLDW